METKYEAQMARTLREEQHQNTEDHHTTCADTYCKVGTVIDNQSYSELATRHRTLKLCAFMVVLTLIGSGSGVIYLTQKLADKTEAVSHLDALVSKLDDDLVRIGEYNNLEVHEKINELSVELARLTEKSAYLEAPPLSPAQ
jgi:hypothetical protein